MFTPAVNGECAMASRGECVLGVPQMPSFDCETTLATTSLSIAEMRAKTMFDRVLASWASDLLELRRLDLASPGWREQVDGLEGPEWRRAA